MARAREEILAPARTELTRGRPRAALRELELARAELVQAGDRSGLAIVLELARSINALAAVDRKTRERLIEQTERDISAVAPAPVGVPVLVPLAPISTEQILAPAHAQIERRKTGRALRELEKARRKLLARSHVDGLSELIELAQQVAVTKQRHEQARARLIEAARQNVRYLSRRSALSRGQEWNDPYVAGKPKTKLPSLPPMTRRDKIIAAGVVVAIAAVATTWALANRAPQRVAHAIECPTGKQGSPTWSPDGEEIAFAANGTCGTQIKVIPAEGGQPIQLTRGFGELPDWSPDGKWIVYQSTDGFSLVSAYGGEPRLLRADDGDTGASWSPDGKRIAFVHGLTADPDINNEGDFLSTLYTMSPDGSNVRRLIGHECNPRTPDWSPSGDYLVFACDDGVYDLPANGGTRSQLIEADFDIWPVSLSVNPDGESLAYGWSGVELFQLEEANDPETLIEVDGWEEAQVDVAWSPDGKRIAYSITGLGSEDGLYVASRDGRNSKLLVEL